MSEALENYIELIDGAIEPQYKVGEGTVVEAIYHMQAELQRLSALTGNPEGVKEARREVVERIREKLLFSPSTASDEAMQLLSAAVKEVLDHEL